MGSKAATNLAESGAKIYQSVSQLTNEVAGKLAQTLTSQTQGEVLFGAADKARYATDASIYQIVPTGVFVPRTSTDVTTAVEICRSLKVPITARGGGTSQCGQTVGAGLVIDYSKYLRQVTSLDIQNRSVTVEPGIVLDHLNAQLKPHGLWYPVDVSTSAQASLGGMSGNNSCGSRSLAYGNMVHNVRGIQTLLSDGSTLNLGAFASSSGAELSLGEFVRGLAHTLQPQISEHWPKVMRRVAGYNLDIFCNQSERPYTLDGSVNLAHLMVGSEGTLGLTQQLTLGLTELPKTKILGVVNFASFYRAMDAAQHIVRAGGSNISAVELVDRTMIELSLGNPTFAPTVRSALIANSSGELPEALLLVEYFGESKVQLASKMRELVDLMGELGLPNSVVELTDDTAQKNLWEVRKAGLNIMMSLRGDGKPVSFIEDCAVPLEHLAEYTEALSQVFRQHGSRGTWYAHASVGTLHVRPILDMRRDGAEKMREIALQASELVRKYRGAYSGEHGDGLCRGEWIKWQFGEQITDAFGAIKNYLDPSNVFNPKRIIDPPRMDDVSLMRYSPQYKVVPLTTALDWSTWNVQNNPVTEQTTSPGTGADPAEGFAKAVEMCNNNGHCRKFDAGTMCPSYRVTRNERDVTRGRANTLRMALSGQLEGGIHHPEVAQAMELCVSCKGCKRDCPTGVDMAKMKVEYLHQLYQSKPRSLKDKLISSLPDYAHVASRFASVLNLRNYSPWLRVLSEKFLSFSAQRSLPEWQSNHFFKQSADAKNGLVSFAELVIAARPVALFVDTFNGYFENDNVWSAVRVLQAAGYTVHWVNQNPSAVQQHLCCGRTHLASGQVHEAKQKLKALLAALEPIAQKGIAIVGLEPSCLLTLRDEALAMGLGEPAQLVANHSMLLDEFLIRETKANRMTELIGKLKPAQREVLLHGHCHQKAFGTVPSILQAIALVPNAKPKLIESSCCGMAGAFGYEAKHFAVSMQMAELNLLPALRANANSWVVADGTSCRHQITDGAQREAVSLARFLDAHLDDVNARQLPTDGRDF